MRKFAILLALAAGVSSAEPPTEPTVDQAEMSKLYDRFYSDLEFYCVKNLEISFDEETRMTSCRVSDRHLRSSDRAALCMPFIMKHYAQRMALLTLGVRPFDEDPRADTYVPFARTVEIATSNSTTCRGRVNSFWAVPQVEAVRESFREAIRRRDARK